MKNISCRQDFFILLIISCDMFVIYRKWKWFFIEHMQSKWYQEGGQKDTLEQARGPPGDAQDSQSDATHGAPQGNIAPWLSWG